ncbi:MAG: TolC family protein [Deltaproteobacteria bacterium]|nr:TolC family protein [Deltaproteobacteria bacterium]MBN2673333.1 TolC family protein [Deltaproteobacteria bacterium]
MKYYRLIHVKFLLVLSLILAAGAAMAADKSDDGGHSKTIPGAPWASFNDPVLNELIHRAIDEDFSIQVALSRIEQAEAQVELARASLLPKVYGEGSYALNGIGPSSSSGSSAELMEALLGALAAQNIQIDVPEGTSSAPDYSQSFTAKLVAQYNIDITGRYVKAREAAQKDLSASIEDVHAQAVAITSLVVQAYYDVVTAKLRVKLVETQIANYEKLLKLILAQFNVGSSNALEVLQQRAQLEAKKAQLPLVNIIVESGKVQLASLVGDTVESLPEIDATLPFVTSPLEVPDTTVLTRHLQENLPQLKAQQIRITALKDREVSARRALLPTLGVFGNVGYQWIRMDGGDSSDGDVWGLGATLTVPIYMGGANHASLKQARAATLGAQYSYENAQRQSVSAVLLAKEREDAQRAYVQALEIQTQVTEQTVTEATKRYVAGLSTYLNVLSANDALQLNELNLLQAKRDLLNARISLLEALGGAWTRELVADQTE